VQIRRQVLVTGGFGFLGSHLIERLFKDPETAVVVVDNQSSSTIDIEAFLQRLQPLGRLTHEHCAVAEFCQRERHRRRPIDEIYHLASVVGPVSVLAHSGQITRSILDDLYRVIELAQQTGARLCDVSTSEIYGGGRSGLCSEDDPKVITSTHSPRLEYALGKLAGEVALQNTVRVSDLFGVIIRPFNVAGPRQGAAGGFVLPRFIHQALRGEPLTVYGDGRMTRAFTHVGEVADGLVRAVRLGRSGRAYNLANPANRTTVRELAERVVLLTGSSSPIHSVDPRQLFGPLFAEASDKYPDAERARAELGWEPRLGLDAVIRDAVEYIRANRRD
jgi:nucleoside-diphosphate-sugar epimerase